MSCEILNRSCTWAAQVVWTKMDLRLLCLKWIFENWTYVCEILNVSCENWAHVCENWTRVCEILNMSCNWAAQVVWTKMDLRLLGLKWIFETEHMSVKYWTCHVLELRHAQVYDMFLTTIYQTQSTWFLSIIKALRQQLQSVSKK